MPAPAPMDQYIKCPFCKNTYLEQIRLAHLDSTHVRTAMAMYQAIETSFYLCWCPACGEIFEPPTAYGLNFRTKEDHEMLLRSLKAGREKRIKSQEVVLPPMVPKEKFDEVCEHLASMEERVAELVKQVGILKGKQTKQTKRENLDEELE